MEGQVKLVAPLEQDKAFLEEENDKLHQDVQEKTDSLEALKSQMDQLNTENKFLQDDFSEQLRIIDSVRSEAATLLEDVAKLGAENRKILMERDDLADKAAMLEDRVSKLESQVEKQQRALEVKNARPEPPPPVQTSLRESSARSEASQPRVPEKSAPRRTSAATSPLASFESSAAKIMAAARKHPGSGVLAPMKSILLCCKSITEDCEALEDLKSTRPRDIDALQSAKDKISDSLTPLMNAAKQHASQGGNDGSAANIDSQLRTVGHAFSDLAELMVLIRSKGPSPQMAEPAPASPDTVPDTAEYKGSGQSNDPPAIDVRDLIYYLEDQTDDIAHAIQNLLQAMRKAPSDINEITSLVDNILVFVDNIIFETKATIDATPSLHQDMVADCDDVLEFLEQDRKRLLILIEKVGDLHDQRAAKQEIANCSYEMAKVRCGD